MCGAADACELVTAAGLGLCSNRGGQAQLWAVSDWGGALLCRSQAQQLTSMMLTMKKLPMSLVTAPRCGLSPTSSTRVPSASSKLQACACMFAAETANPGAALEQGADRGTGWSGGLPSARGAGCRGAAHKAVQLQLAPVSTPRADLAAARSRCRPAASALACRRPGRSAFWTRLRPGVQRSGSSGNLWAQGESARCRGEQGPCRCASVGLLSGRGGPGCRCACDHIILWQWMQMHASAELALPGAPTPFCSARPARVVISCGATVLWSMKSAPGWRSGALR